MLLLVNENASTYMTHYEKNAMIFSVYVWSNLCPLATQWYTRMIFIIDHDYIQELNNLLIAK